MTMTGGKPSINASAGSTAFNLHIMSGGSLTESFSADLNSDNASSTGTSNITLDNNSTFYNPGYFSLTTTAGETTTVTQNGGLFTAGNGGGGNAMFYNTGTSTYYLNGGVLSAPAVSTLGSATTSLGTFIFNGGTLQAQATGGGGNGINAGFFSPPAAEVGKGGGTFDTATNNYGILAVNTGITTDTALDNNGMDGGITKTGTTTLSMNGLSTYNGGTTVLAGTLIDGNATEGVGTGNVKVTPSSAAGATFQMNAATDLTATQSLILTDFTGTPDSALVNLSYTGADTIMSLVDDGSTLAGGLYGAPGSAAVFDGQAVIPEAFISGGGYLNVVGVPEPASFGLIGLVAPVLFGRRRRDRLMVVSE